MGAKFHPILQVLIAHKVKELLGRIFGLRALGYH